MSSSRRALWIVGACLGITLLAYEIVPNDERRIGALLGELCTNLNQTRDAASLAALRQGLSISLRPGAELHVAELGLDLDGLGVISESAQQLLTPAALTFALGSIEVHQSGSLARVEADLLVTVRGSGEQRRDVRRTRVRLSKPTGRWQIEAIEVDPVAFSEPEARP